MKNVTLLLALFLMGCDAVRPEYGLVPNQTERQRIFKECLAAVPEGPERTVYNDWAEVVELCEDAAYRQSLEWRKIRYANDPN